MAIQSMTGTSGRQRAQADTLKRFPVIIPESDALWQALASKINPMFERIAASADESRTLAETRDLLLPKLMSGEIRIRDAEKAIERAA